MDVLNYQPIWIYYYYYYFDAKGQDQRQKLTKTKMLKTQNWTQPKYKNTSNQLGSNPFEVPNFNEESKHWNMLCQSALVISLAAHYLLWEAQLGRFQIHKPLTLSQGLWNLNDNSHICLVGVRPKADKNPWPQDSLSEG